MDTAKEAVAIIKNQNSQNACNPAEESCGQRRLADFRRIMAELVGALVLTQKCNESQF